jgi:aldehyde dehydrogenase
LVDNNDGSTNFISAARKILSYIKLGKEEGAELLTGGEQNHLEGDLAGGYYIKLLFKGNNKMRIFKKRFSDPF